MGYALMGATMAPGFHVSDFEGGERDELMLEYPDQNALIKALTRGGVGTSRS
jgi:predicted cupin superfamily sugar epimerase